MAMDFFEQQDQARKTTGRLIILFSLAVLLIMTIVYFVVAAVVLWYRGRAGARSTTQEIVASWSWSDFFDPYLMVTVGVCVLAVIAGASLYKLMQLRAGGQVIAESLGGRLLDPGSNDLTERKVLNIVEEMAIASGTPVPPVYMMDDEQSINAFAAGYQPDDAVIGVTRGTVEKLDRDELQGVIAHEFSHILNGDMRMNIRLIGVLHGILVIGIIGSVMLRAVFYGAAAGGSSRGGRKGNPLPLIVLAIVLMIVGYVGTFFGKMIKAAVSRQREYLADAAAVQFTRLPDGIAGALKKIGGTVSRGRLGSANAQIASHMYFAEGVAVPIKMLFSTHPDLNDRIKRIDPQWDGTFPDVSPKAEPVQQTYVEAAAGEAVTQSEQERRKQAGLTILGGAVAAEMLGSGAAVAQVGRPTDQHIRYARQLIDSLPKALREAAHSAYGARAVVYALLLDDDQTIRSGQWQRLNEHADANVVEETKKLEPAVGEMRDEARLPLIDLCMPALKELSPDQYEAFRANMMALIQSDEKIDLFEWVLQQIVLASLEPQYRQVKRPMVQYYNLKGLRHSCEIVLSTLTYIGHTSQQSIEHAFAEGAAQLGLGQLQQRSKGECTLDAMNTALGHFKQVVPKSKRTVLQAVASCIAADKEITVREGELMRGIADALACPMPPLLPGQPVADDVPGLQEAAQGSATASK